MCQYIITYYIIGRLGCCCVVLTGGQQCDEADKGQRPTKARTTRESGHLKGCFSATTVCLN